MGYVQAITTAVELAGVVGGGVKYLFDHADDIKKNIDNLLAMLKSAQELLNAAGEVVNTDALKHQPEPIEVAAEVEVIADDPEAGTEARKAKKGKSRAFVKNAVDKAAVFADNRVSDVNKWKVERELRKQVHAAKKTVLNGANIKMSLKKLVEQLNSENEAVRLANMGVLDASGCFAIATYGKLDFGGDPTDYRGIYIGKADCVGDGIAQTIVASGNPDVYADIKYKQNVWVYVFSCVPDMLDEKYTALINLLGADESYNASEAGE